MRNTTENNSPKLPRRYKTFVVYGHRNQLKIWLFALLFLFAGYWCVDYYLHYLALRDLSLTPEVVDQDGVILQQTDYGCAPASLAMLLRDKGINVTQYQMAKDLYTGIFGTWARDIPRAAKKYGFDVETKDMNFDEIIDTNLPMIIEEKDAGVIHVVYAVPDLAGRLLHVKDPSVGFRLLDKTGFYEYFLPTEKKRCFVFRKSQT